MSVSDILFCYKSHLTLKQLSNKWWSKPMEKIVPLGIFDLALE